MTDDSTDALEQALALHATPGRLPMLLNRRLPREIMSVIRIAAGDAEAMASAQTRTGANQRLVVDAAVLYIQQILFKDGADSYRLLGVDADADADTVKEHYRWLMRWLHPDRHPERWEAVYSERVNRAWNSLNSPQRRRDYDAQAHALAPAMDATSTVLRQRLRRRSNVPETFPRLSPQTVHRLPAIVLGGLAFAAAIVLALFGWLQHDQQMSNGANDQALAKPAAAENDSVAQETAVRQQIALEEHAIALSQPPLQSAQTMAKQDALRAPVVQSGQPAPPNDDASPQEPGSESHAIVPATSANAMSATSVTPEPSQAGGRKTPGISQRVVQPSSGTVSTPNPTAGAKSATSESGRPHSPVVSVANPGRNQAGRLSQSAVTSPIGPILASPRQSIAQASSVRQVRALASTMDPARPTAELPPPAEIAGPVHAATNFAANASISPQDAIKLVPLGLEDAYAKGDLGQMMRLFAPNAVNNRGGIEAIRQDYEHLFRGSVSRQLRLEDLKWTVLPDRIAGSGAFEAQIRHGDEQVGRHVRGWIQIEVVPIDGSWKIQRLVHRNAE